MSRVVMEIPSEVLLALKVSSEDLGKELRLAAAMNLYEIGLQVEN